MENINAHGRAPRGETAPSTEPLAVGAEQAAKLLGIGRRLLWTKTNQREIPHVRLGRRVLYPVPALHQWLADQAAKGVRR